MTEIEHVTTTTQIIQILPGDPPRIVTGKWLYKQGKRTKFVQLMVSIPDATLYERFKAEVCAGDSVQLTIATEWGDMGYGMYLTDFALVAENTRKHQDVLDNNPQLVKENAA